MTQGSVPLSTLNHAIRSRRPNRQAVLPPSTVIDWQMRKDASRAAVSAGELPADFDCDGVAGFIVSSQQGANLLAKAERGPAPVERFKKILFEQILR